MAEICLWCPPVCCFPALLYASLPGRTCAGMGLKCLNSPCPLLKNSTVLAFQWAACVKCPANHWMKRVILQFSSNENDFWEGCRLRAMLPLQYYQYILAANVISFFFNIKGRGYDFWAVIVWRHYLGRPPKLSCINLDVLDMSSVLLTAAEESLGPWLMFAESTEIANYVFWCFTSSFSYLFSVLLLMVFLSYPFPCHLQSQFPVLSFA